MTAPDGDASGDGGTSDDDSQPDDTGATGTIGDEGGGPDIPEDEDRDDHPP